MIYALRKLIAFVFLGGMFWFIYQDLDNLDKPWFMHALGLIAIVFAFFWLLIPMVVVRFRIAARRRQNLTRYGEWRAALGPGGPPRRSVPAARSRWRRAASGSGLGTARKSTFTSAARCMSAPGQASMRCPSPAARATWPFHGSATSDARSSASTSTSPTGG